MVIDSSLVPFNLDHHHESNAKRGGNMQGYVRGQIQIRMHHLLCVRCCHFIHRKVYVSPLKVDHYKRL